ncbi:cupin domain-containing protein [Nocardioides sp.]|uniref:cupin domain-containing protein n=1 Tax=Nocardioides sp. TaxID=35761 RepID=UPI002C7DBF62|nr:cupin domain-containing protein [Nocardioides sp.]HXH79571.1 cupin domain-containing protein [Nocardioides sp.]
MNTTGTAAARLLSPDLMLEPVEPDGGSDALATADRVLGSPGRRASTLGGHTIGLWEAGPGNDVDVESDELFLVLSGSGTVTFDDGSSVDLQPGVLVELHEGDRTTWVISERLRKLYLA